MFKPENKLLRYITENNPDLLLQLEKENTVKQYLQDKVASVDTSLPEEIYMEQLTEDVLPSKYNYVLSVLEEVFDGYVISKQYKIRLVEICDPLFNEYNFSISEDDRFLRYAIIGTIKEFLEK